MESYSWEDPCESHSTLIRLLNILDLQVTWDCWKHTGNNKNKKKERKEYDLALEYIPTVGSDTALVSKEQQCLNQK